MMLIKTTFFLPPEGGNGGVAGEGTLIFLGKSMGGRGGVADGSGPAGELESSGGGGIGPAVLAGGWLLIGFQGPQSLVGPEGCGG